MEKPKMVKSSILLLLICFFSPAISQVISDVKVSQQEQRVVVQYILNTDHSCRIDLFVSLNDGGNWIGPLKNGIGDIGEKINSGNKTIYWNVLDEMETLSGDKIRFKVVASSFKSVQIGKQIWMSDNLNINQFSNGDPIMHAKTKEEWLTAGENKQPAWCYYNYDPTNDKMYGKLYNWFALIDSRGLAPIGWHLPNDKEWSELIQYLGGELVAGGKMKVTGTNIWSHPNYNATNQSWFSGLPGGEMNSWGISYNIGSIGVWWCYDEKNPSCFLIEKNSGIISQVFAGKEGGLSVRCVRDYNN